MEDVMRVLQGIATGIGFIGARSILELAEERRDSASWDLRYRAWRSAG
jgi:hypothetical protein